jgi:hypothetical protein
MQSKAIDEALVNYEKKMSKHLLTLYLEEICKSDAQSLQLKLELEQHYRWRL